MTYTIIENGTVVNAIAADEAFAAQIGAIPLPDGIRIGDLYVDGEFVRVEPDEPEIEPMSMPEEDEITALRAEIALMKEQMAQLTAQQAATTKEAPDAKL